VAGLKKQLQETSLERIQARYVEKHRKQNPAGGGTAGGPGGKDYDPHKRVNKSNVKLEKVLLLIKEKMGGGEGPSEVRDMFMDLLTEDCALRQQLNILNEQLYILQASKLQKFQEEYSKHS